MERLSEKLKNVLYNCIDSISEFQQDILDDAINFMSNAEIILGNDYDLDRLRDLVEADKAGRCVVFKFGIGQTVYRAWVRPDWTHSFVSKNIMKTAEVLINAEKWSNAHNNEKKAWDEIAALKGEQYERG